MKKERILFLGNTVLVVGVFLFVLASLIVIFLKSLKNNAFRLNISNKAFIAVYSALLMGCSVGIWLVITKVAGFGREITLGQYGLISIGCVLALITFIMKKIREQR